VKKYSPGNPAQMSIRECEVRLLQRGSNYRWSTLSFRSLPPCHSALYLPAGNISGYQLRKFIVYTRTLYSRTVAGVIVPTWNFTIVEYWFIISVIELYL
jgi:hypothetical protein